MEEKEWKKNGEREREREEEKKYYTLTFFYINI